MRNDRVLSKYALILIPLGILINFLGVQLALHFQLPLFLDSIGTVLCAVLGGYLPGIIVGFLSNIINCFSDPITLYYGIISILIAVTATFLSRRGAFSRLRGALLAVLLFTILGGGLGSVLTWLLYGFNFGMGISAPFAALLHEGAGLSKFAAQLAADMGIDIADKLITVALVFLTVRLFPQKGLAKLPLGPLYMQGALRQEGTAKSLKEFPRHSLRNEVVVLIVTTGAILGALAMAISFGLYKDTMTKRYISTCSGAVRLVQSVINADNVNAMLARGVEDDAHAAVERRLMTIRDSFPDIMYLYVYQIREDGCHVVFDLDTPSVSGGALGDVIPITPSFTPYLDDLLAGREIPPLITNETFGYLLTVYLPVYDGENRCVAYAAADISMNDVITDRYVFAIRMADLLFGVAIIIVVLTIWFAERRLIDPINAMTRAADAFAYDNEANRVSSTKRLQTLSIHTGNEIESLYRSFSKTVTDVAAYITTIDKLQSNIIVSFASMVESRDHNTGEHIRRTAAYVRAIAKELQKSGLYPDILSDEYVDDLERSAPLHDVGKIKIPDALLNKPGKLSAEEFEQMKTHTTAGREILKGTVESLADIRYVSHAIDMAAYHHERWDGRGYPEGLAGEDIPLCARIMAVADVFDALISKRSYKEPFSPEQARAIIQSEAGSHFDPVVAAAFLRVYDTLVEH